MKIDLICPLGFDAKYTQKRCFSRQFTKWVKLRFFEKTGKLLDIGCGMGNYLDDFKQLGYDVYGIDIDKNNIKLCKEKKLNVKICDMETEKLPFPNNFFDFVFSKHVIEHIDNTENFLSEIKRVLKPNGITFIMTENWDKTHKNFFIKDITHKKPFTLDSFKQALLKNNFNIVTIKNFRNMPIIWRYFVIAFDPVFIKSRDMFVLAKKKSS